MQSQAQLRQLTLPPHSCLPTRSSRSSAQGPFAVSGLSEEVREAVIEAVSTANHEETTAVVTDTWDRKSFDFLVKTPALPYGPGALARCHVGAIATVVAPGTSWITGQHIEASGATLL